MSTSNESDRRRFLLQIPIEDNEASIREQLEELLTAIYDAADEFRIEVDVGAVRCFEQMPLEDRITPSQIEAAIDAAALEDMAAATVSRVFAARRPLPDDPD